MPAEPLDLVVRNTFIEARPSDEAERGSLQGNRTQSDPTGGRSQQVRALARPRKQSSEDEENTGQLEAVDDDDEDEYEEAEDDVPLARTQSVAYPANAAYASLGRTISAASTTDPLQRCLTGGGEDATFAAAMPTFGEQSSYAPHMMPWTGMPMMFQPAWQPIWNSMMPYGAEHQTDGSSAKEDEAETRQAVAGAWEDEHLVPELGEGPPLGSRHRFHQETKDMGIVSPDFRQFTKVGYEGRLSVVSESRVHNEGKHRYLVQFTSGELSKADGVGFVFSHRLPCAKNIQRIVSIFVNQRGRICMRVFNDIVRASAKVKHLELGDWVEMAVDLEAQVCTFYIWGWTPSGWPPLSGKPASTAQFSFGSKMAKLNREGQKTVKLNVGHLACVVKNVGVTITLFS